MNTETKPRGGARKGSGRKPGKNTVPMTFSIPIATAQALKAFSGNKSRLVAEAIMKVIGGS